MVKKRESHEFPRPEGPHPLTPGQAAYCRALEQSRVVLCLGPAGTGKTFLSCRAALAALHAGEVKRIVLTRPLVHCGRGAGHLPGDMGEKVSPFTRVLKDALTQLSGDGDVEKMFRDGVVEFVALDDMRGMTLRHSFVVADEMQNAELHQLHMALTRIGPGSRMALCGDASGSQTDLRHGSPLPELERRILARGPHPQVRVVRLGREDCIRDPLVRWLDEAVSGEWGEDEIIRD